jgi:small subunit ribosomal protein S2
MQETELETSSVSSGAKAQAKSDEVSRESLEDELEMLAESMTKEGESANNSPDPAIIREMIEAGLCYGRRKSKTHPKMKPYILSTRNGIELIDVEQTWHALERALEAIKNVAASGGEILLVGTQPAAHESVFTLASKFGLPYVINRWVGGTLTNFNVILRRIEYFRKIKADRAAGQLEKYTKKERLDINRRIAKMEELFSGMEKMTKLPSLLIIVNANLHKTAIREARRVGIPAVVIMSSDGDPTLVEYPIPANDNSKRSIAWFFAKFADAISQGRKEAEEKALAAQEGDSGTKTNHTK